MILILCLGGTKLLLHLLTNHHYGYHRDELYFLACADHLSAGYVDHSPGIAWIAWFGRNLFGDSVRAIRFLPALFGSATLLLTCAMCRRLGGGFGAILIAGISFLIAPLYLRSHNMLNIVVFDQFWWVLAIYLVLRTLQTGRNTGWLWVGGAVGLGLLTKHTMIFLCFGLAVGFLLTPHRKQLLNPYLWGGIGIALLLFLPNLIWQMTHQWATLEFLRELNLNRMQQISRLEFLLGQILYLNPFTFPVWITGLGFFMISPRGKDYRLFGWVFLIVLFVFLAAKSKVYYLGPAYPMLFAAGGVAFEHFFERRNLRWGIPTTGFVLAVGGLSLLPLSLPVLSIGGFKNYAAHFRRILPNSREVAQDYSDMFGWEEMAQTVAKVYASMDPKEQERCCILTGNYGEAGAIDKFGRELGLPHAHSGHNSYFYWGPGERKIETILTVGIPQEVLTDYCGRIEKVAIFSPDEPEMGERNVPIFICRDFVTPLAEAWPQVRHYD